MAFCGKQNMQLVSKMQHILLLPCFQTCACICERRLLKDTVLHCTGFSSSEIVVTSIISRFIKNTSKYLTV